MVEVEHSVDGKPEKGLPPVFAGSGIGNSVFRKSRGRSSTDIAQFVLENSDKCDGRGLGS